MKITNKEDNRDWGVIRPDDYLYKDELINSGVEEIMDAMTFGIFAHMEIDKNFAVETFNEMLKQRLQVFEGLGT